MVKKIYPLKQRRAARTEASNASKINPLATSDQLLHHEIYHLALDQLSIIVVTDRESIITYANKNFCRISQYSLPELVGQPYHIISADYYPPSFFTKLVAVIMTGQGWRGEVKNKAKDGSYFWLDVSIYTLKDPAGHITGHFSSCLDITAKKNTEEEIILQVKKTNHIIDNNPDGFLIVDGNWRITRVNKMFEDAVGQCCDKIIGQNFLHFFINNTGPHSALATLEQAMQNQKPVHFEWYYPPRQIWFEVNGYTSGDDLVLTFRNISEQKATADQIRQSERRLHAVIQSTPDTFFLIGPDRRLISFNERARRGVKRLFNRDLQAGDDIRTYIFDDNDARVCAQAFEKALQGERVQIEREVRTNGQTNWYWMTYFPVHDIDGQLLGVALNSTNINNLKFFEAEILRVNARFQLVAQATQDAIYDWNIELDEIRWYGAFYNMFGYPEQAVGASLEWWANRLHPDDQTRVLASLYNALDHQHAHWLMEYRFRCGDNSYKLVYERGYILYTGTGAPTRMIGALQDMQQLKEHESKITAQNEQLRAIAFAQSHEVRRPLANILGLLKCLNQAELSPENQEIVAMLEQTSTELDTVIRKIIDKTAET